MPSMEGPGQPGVSMVTRIRLASCRAASLMPPSMYSALIGSISSPILISITRGCAAALEAELVCAFANGPFANTSARTNGMRRMATSGLLMQRENKTAGEELREKERACAVRGDSRVSAGTRRRHIPASLYQSARRRVGPCARHFLKARGYAASLLVESPSLLLPVVSLPL